MDESASNASSADDDVVPVTVMSPRPLSPTTVQDSERPPVALTASKKGNRFSNTLKGVFGGGGATSPRGGRTSAWTRDEDNTARLLRVKREAGTLDQREAELLKGLEARERAFLEAGMQNLNELAVIMLCVVSGSITERGARAFAEVKLRHVNDSGQVDKSLKHLDPQKFTTKAVPVSSPAADVGWRYEWREQVKLAIPTSDAIRVSLFTSRVVGKEKQCSLDIRMSDLLPYLPPGGDMRKWIFPATRGTGSVELMVRRL